MRHSFGRRWHARYLHGLTARELIAQTWQRIDDQAILSRSAAISFYGTAALVPFMGLVIALLAHGLPWIRRALPGYLQLDPIAPLAALLPAEAVSLIEVELNRLRAEPRAGLLSFGLGVLLWLSSSVFVEIIDAMHAIRGIKDTRPFWKRRLIAMVLTLGAAGILISATLTIVIWPQILGWLGLSQGVSVMATIVHTVVVTLTVYLTLELAIQVGSNTVQTWRWFTPGCALGTVVVVGASLLLRFYAQRWADYGATYGSLAGIMLLMTWLWLSSLALLVAAVFNKVIDDAALGVNQRYDAGRCETTLPLGRAEGDSNADSRQEKGNRDPGASIASTQK
jgi:membrane protein